jgi:hypothetical protein
MAFSGVLSSCEIFARKADLSLSLSSAFSFAIISSCWALIFSDMSFDTDSTPRLPSGRIILVSYSATIQVEPSFLKFFTSCIFVLPERISAIFLSISSSLSGEANILMLFPRISFLE